MHVSWNGATDVSQWRVLAGETTTSLMQIAAAPRSGFETSLYLHTELHYVAVQAISGSGRVLAGSRIIHLAITQVAEESRPPVLKGDDKH